MRLRVGEPMRQRPAAGGLQALLAVGLGEVQQAQAGAVALLGMRAGSRTAIARPRACPGRSSGPSSAAAPASTAGAGGATRACARGASCACRAGRSARARRHGGP